MNDSYCLIDPENQNLVRTMNLSQNCSQKTLSSESIVNPVPAVPCLGEHKKKDLSSIHFPNSFK